MQPGAWSLADAAQQWLTDFWKPEGQHLDVLEAELPLALKLQPNDSWDLGRLNNDTPEGRSVWFVTGGIDLLTGTVVAPVMWDWKTAGRGWSGQQGTGNNQKEAYALLLEENGYEPPSEMNYVVYDRSKHAWRIHPAKITRQSIDAYVMRVEGWVAYMLNPFHLCTPTDGKQRGWWAKPDYNDVWDSCPTCRYLGDQYDNQEKKVQSW